MSLRGLAVKTVMICSALVLLAPGTTQANGWGSWGSSGGYYGSSGGSSGGYAVRPRWTPVRNLLGGIANHIHSKHRYRGSSGSAYGSSGGSYGSSGGYYGSSGGYYGSSGGSYGYSSFGSSYSLASTGSGMYPYSGMTTAPLMAVDSCCAPVYGSPVYGSPMPTETARPVYGTDGESPTKPATEGESGQPASEPAPVDPNAPQVGPGNTEETGIYRDDSQNSVLALEVPEGAEVFINGQATSTTGAERRYAVHDMDPNQEYRYDVKVVFNRDGLAQVKENSVVLKPGFEHKLAFDFSELTTTLTLDVPADARVLLCGQPTSKTGTSRTFSTRSLKAGETWENYRVEVQTLQNGEWVTLEQTIDLRAGETRHLALGIEGMAAVESVVSR